MVEDDETHRVVARLWSQRFAGALATFCLALATNGFGLWAGNATRWIALGLSVGVATHVFVGGLMYLRRPPKVQVKTRLHFIPQPGADKAAWHGGRLVGHYEVKNCSREDARIVRVDIATKKWKWTPAGETGLNLDSGAELQADQTTIGWFSCALQTPNARTKDLRARVTFTDELGNTYSQTQTFKSGEAEG